MQKIIFVSLFLLFSCTVNAQVCDETLDQIKQMSSGNDQAVLTLMNTLESSGCIDQVGVKSFHWNRGNLRSRLNEFKGAIEDLTLLMGLDMSVKDRSAIQSLRGFCLMSLKDYDAAEKDFTASLALRPKQKKTYHLLATTRLFKNDRPGAQRAIEALKSINPTDPQLLIEVGKFYFDFGYYPEAVETLKAFLIQKPGDHNALFAIGIACMKQKQTKEAYSWFMKSFTADPGHVVALNNALAILHQNQEYDKAMTILMEKTKHRSEIDILQIRANIYEAAGWCGDAAFWYEQMALVSSIKKAEKLNEKAKALKDGCSVEFKAHRHVLKYQ